MLALVEFQNTDRLIKKSALVSDQGQRHEDTLKTAPRQPPVPLQAVTKTTAGFPVFQIFSSFHFFSLNSKAGTRRTNPNTLFPSNIVRRCYADRC